MLAAIRWLRYNNNEYIRWSISAGAMNVYDHGRRYIDFIKTLIYMSFLGLYFNHGTGFGHDQ
jgi:hypothetical protein